VVGTRRSVARDGLWNRLQGFMLTHFAWFWRLAGKVEPLGRLVNAKLVNNAIYKTSTRPYAFSTMSPYTSWDSLTDRTFSGRHLPEATAGADRVPPPAVEDLVELFRRGPGGTIVSDKSTLLFPYFAQWFTDGFLRTDRNDWCKNTSNHEIDLSQLYGLNPSITRMIREGGGGRLRYQTLGGEDYPPYYHDGDGPRPEFRDLPIKIQPGLPPGRMATIFAMGGERANVNIGYTMMNILFLREHNRVCGELARAYPRWDDERLFQTARNILIALLIKIVLEEYINHITPYYYKFRLHPTASPNQRWRRQNWMSVEFNLLYRWHGLVPDTVRLGDEELPVEDASFNSPLITRRGLGASFEAATLQPAGRVGMRNTPSFLLPTEKASIELGRAVRLRGYNDYRAACKYPRVTDFDQISGDPEVQGRLAALYGHVDNIEFYTGLFAEDTREHSAVGPMIGRLVGVDAFSQALTNPLLSYNVYNRETFSPVGWTILHETRSLSEILHRNLPPGGPTFRVSLTREGAKVE
jgi:prostaglandin-endoperoxide synthase 2